MSLSPASAIGRICFFSLFFLTALACLAQGCLLTSSAPFRSAPLFVYACGSVPSSLVVLARFITFSLFLFLLSCSYRWICF